MPKAALPTQFGRNEHKRGGIFFYMSNKYTLGIDIGSTTVKIAILDENDTLLFADYQRHFANIQETLADLLEKAYEKIGRASCRERV